MGQNLNTNFKYLMTFRSKIKEHLNYGTSVVRGSTVGSPQVRCDCQLCSLSPSSPPSSPPLPSPLPFIHADQDPPSYAAKFPPCEPWTTMNRNASLLSSAHHRLHCSSSLTCAPPRWHRQVKVHRRGTQREGQQGHHSSAVRKVQMCR
jgi:hypothetical protein